MMEKIKSVWKDGLGGYKFDDKTLGDFLQDIGGAEELKGRIDHPNDSDETKMLLASRIEEDIQQYLPDTADIWGDELVRVEIVEDNAFVVWKDYKMPTTAFYSIVLKNGGVVEPKDFESHEDIS